MTLIDALRKINPHATEDELANLVDNVHDLEGLALEEFLAAQWGYAYDVGYYDGGLHLVHKITVYLDEVDLAVTPTEGL